MRREEVEKKEGDRSSSTETEHSRNIIVIVATASSLAKKARNLLIADTSMACSDRECREDKFSHSELIIADRICT